LASLKPIFIVFISF